ncbi:MAG: OmpA family protein [Oscillospiraceae bacterium]|nr:OmpA family protein [Oscillospiraceae bacterium]
MSSASDRRKSSGGGDEGGGANWMDTYGDLVTLLLTFFVLLFSFSTIDAAKWQALVGSFTGIYAIGIDPISPTVAVENPIPQFGMPLSEDDNAGAQSQEDTSSANAADAGNVQHNLAQIVSIMSGYIDEGEISADLMVFEDEFLVKLVFNDRVFFDTAEATVLPEAYPVLDTVIDMMLELGDLYSMMRVEGHTDSRSINTVRYPSNWDLSADRAVKVVSYIRQDGRLDKSRIVANGYGEEHPIAPNDTPENMALNRRVEFVVEARGRSGNGGYIG